MLDFVTETDFTRIIEEHENLVELLEKKRIAGMEIPERFLSFSSSSWSIIPHNPRLSQ